MDGGGKVFGTGASSLLQWYWIVRLTYYLYPHYRRSDTPMFIIINASIAINNLVLSNISNSTCFLSQHVQPEAANQHDEYAPEQLQMRLGYFIYSRSICVMYHRSHDPWWPGKTPIYRALPFYSLADCCWCDISTIKREASRKRAQTTANLWPIKYSASRRQTSCDQTKPPRRLSQKTPPTIPALI